MFKQYIKKLHNLPEINYNKSKIIYSNINCFNDINERNYNKKNNDKKNNDKNNKIRENIIGAIINDKIDKTYYKYSFRWTKLQKLILKYIKKLTNNTEILQIECIHKGGRKYKYDFELIINDISYNIEFKFNTNTQYTTPQFISLMKISKYLTNSFEEQFYDNYLLKLSKYLKTPIPEKEIYLKEINSPNPNCMKLYQQMYYNGCSTSSRYTNDKNHINFYKYANKLSRQFITEFITNTELSTNILSQYLQDTQANKIYMLYNKHNIYLEHTDTDDYIISSYKKNPVKFRYETVSRNGINMNILLRWKNGNGIAYPAIQISSKIGKI
jgi:hypothetical protein